MVDAKQCECHATLICPPGWAGSWNIQPVTVCPTSGGFFQAGIYANWGTPDEAYNNHSGSDTTAQGVTANQLGYKDITSSCFGSLADGDVAGVNVGITNSSTNIKFVGLEVVYSK